MWRNAKSSKRNERARKGILIAPLKLPRFFGRLTSPVAFFSPSPLQQVGFRPRFARPRRHLYQGSELSLFFAEKFVDC